MTQHLKKFSVINCQLVSPLTLLAVGTLLIEHFWNLFASSKIDIACLMVNHICSMEVVCDILHSLYGMGPVIPSTITYSQNFSVDSVCSYWSNIVYTLVE